MIEMFVNDKLDAAAGVRQPLEAYAKDHPEMRVMSGAFQQIQQAMGTPKGRTAGAKYLAGFVEEMKASGFVAEALKRSGQVAQVRAAGEIMQPNDGGRVVSRESLPREICHAPFRRCRPAR